MILYNHTTAVDKKIPNKWSNVITFSEGAKMLPMTYLSMLKESLRKKCLYPEFFWPAFSYIWTEYGDLQNKSPYSVRMREHTDQKTSEYEHFSGSDYDRSIDVYF